jgi:hypothetical protein
MKYYFKTKDETEATKLINAEKYYNALNEINYNMRRKYLKYGDYSESEYAILEKVFDDIAHHISNEGINLDLD